MSTGPRLASIVTFLLVPSTLLAADALHDAFKSPPAAYRPHTWWHWIDGNVTREGITADLEAMKQGGIGGAHIFNAGSFGDNRGSMPRGPIQYNTPEWRALMVHAMGEARRLGLEITIHNCCGWSSSGGPWVKPEDAMKQVVWSSAAVTGPGDIELALPKPPTVRSFYRDLAVFALPEVKVGARSQGVLAWLSGLGGNEGEPFRALNWPVINGKEVVDLTAMVKDGKLTWQAPEGRWTILRMGYTLTGTQNVASSDSGRGLEVDKLSAESLDRFFDEGLLPLIREAGPLAGDSFTTVLIDSYETGYQNWAVKLPEEFQKRRGYELRPYLPALAGVAIGDVDSTERFLFDYRRTLAELWAENYSGRFAERLKEYKLKLAVEPYGNGNFDTFAYSEPAGLIMGEYWVGEGQINGSVKLAASVAHVLGRPVVGAEALTAGEDRAGWRNHPYEWKPFADRGFTRGINRIIYHRFTHQPWASGVVPGMTMGPWGSHVDRTQTWWPLAASWNAYLSRCQYLLQSGQFVADVCLYGGEDASMAEPHQMHGVPAVPAGYDFDYCGASSLLHAEVRDGRVVLPSGMSYRVLALPAVEYMSPKVASKVSALARQGATVAGPKARRSVGLQNKEPADYEVNKLMNEAGVISDRPLAEVLKQIGLGPDFRCEARNLSWIHRRIGEADVYFVAWFGRGPCEQTCFFRMEGRQPELWDPETGLTQDAPLWRTVPGGVEMPVRLGPAGSVFVVFREKAAGADPIAEVRAELPAAEAAEQVHILKAEYGVLGDATKTRDVTKVVAEAMASIGEIPVENPDMGGDPAYLVVKQLRVTYTIGKGQPQTVTLGEHETLRLGEVRPSAPPAWEVRTAAGAARLHAWQSAKYEVRSASGRSAIVQADVPAPVTVEGPWEVRFPKGWDAPDSTTFEKLMSWTDHSEFGIKYFSGTATYAKKINVPAEWLGAERRVVLDLGSVREVAQVRVNGQDLGVRWWPPFRVDVTEAVKAGENDLEVRVTNLWVNRLVGDEQFPDDIGWDGVTFRKWPEWLVKGQPRPEPRRKTFTTWRHNAKDTPLSPSGLLGPVTLRAVRVYPVALTAK